MTNLNANLQALLDKQEIQEVIYQFARAVDRRDWRLAAACYHDDAVDDHGVFTGPASEYLPWAAENLPKLFHSTTHFVGNIMIELAGDVAHSEAYLVGFHRYQRKDGSLADFVGGARYIDRFERRAGAWKIAHRLLVWDWVRDDPVTTTFEGVGIDPATLAFGRYAPDDPSYARSR